MIKFFSDKSEWTVMSQGLYSDGTPMVKMPEFDDVVKHATGMLLLGAPSITELFTAISLAHSVNRQRDVDNWLETLVLPYIPGARQDRVNPEGDVLFTLYTVSELINSADFDRVVCLDPHSPASHWINNLVEYPMAYVYDRLWKGYSGVIAPDKGGRARAELAANTLGVPVVYAEKTRDVSNGRLTGFKIDVEKGAHYLVVDDICDGGGTFIGLGELIKEQGAFADLFVTHGIFAKGVKELSKHYKSIYHTDSIGAWRDLYDTYTIPVVDRMMFNHE